MAIAVAGSLSPWLLGWIAATPSDRIFFFFPPKVAREGGGWQRLLAGGGRWAAVSGGVWVDLVG